MTLHWKQEDGVAVATIDRPEARNALDAALCDDLRTRIEVAPGAGVRAIVLTGVGSAFCAGADLARRRNDTGGDGGGIEHGGGDTFRPAFELLGDAIEACPAPVIAAMNGHALGAGLQLAVHCDLRILGPDARVGIPAVKLGVLVSASNTTRLVRLVGPGAANEILLTGRPFSATEALALGLVHRIDDDPLAAARDTALLIASLAPLSVAAHKRSVQLVNASITLGPDARTEVQALEDRCFASDDLQEGLAAFAEKRTPVFHGR